MKFLRTWAFGALATAVAVLAACGGGDGDQSPRVSYSKMVVFGDSLSDVGSYATPGLVGATGGGRYTVNGNGARIWVELLAAQAQLAAPCAAQTGLESSGAFAGFAAPITDHPGCFDYAQGGARVTNPIGPANKNVAQVDLLDTKAAVGQLTVPLISQMQRHLAVSGGKYDGSELVTVFAGGNDFLVNIDQVKIAIGQGGPQAAPAAGQAAAVAMATAGGELAAYIKGFVAGRGATHVVVVNLPDVSTTPSASSLDAGTRGLIQTMSSKFNEFLAKGLADVPGVLVVDLFTQSQDQFNNPDLYSLTNVRNPACGTTSALVCSAATLVPGDTSHYAFADDVHPTPYGYQLIAKFVALQMLKAGWL